MNTLREKITFILTGLAYLLFHLRLGSNAGETVYATVYQMLVTAPYCLGFTYIIAVILRKMVNRGWPPWDRLLRIFFTIGILFGFFFALYEYAEQGQETTAKPANAISYFYDENQQVLSYSA